MIQLVETSRASLADVLITNQLGARPTRLPDYAGEAATLRALVNRLAESPHAVLQLLADKIIELTGAQSSGVSISEMDGDEPVFRWHATGGEFAPFVGSTMPRHDSPCGTVLDQNAPLLMRWPERHFPFAPPHPIVEVLLVPFYEGKIPIGTVWAIAHDKQKTFDSEDRRLLTSLSSFAASAVKSLKNLALLEDGKSRVSEESQQKTEFLAMLSHELRNPIGPILMAAHVMRNHSVEAPADRGMLGIITRQSKQLERIIDDLMDVSRAATNKMELRKTRVNLLDIVDTAIESSRANIDLRRHSLRVVQPDRALYLTADSTRMTQVIANLLNNACRYTPEGGDIALVIKPDGDDVTIAVKDNGIGIAREMLERIFEMFVQAGTPHAGGLGIGLTLVKRVVELHGGSIKVNSLGENLGSEFVIRLPL